MTKVPSGVYEAHVDGDAGYITRTYTDDQGRRCTLFPVNCTATTEDNHGFAVFIAAYLNKDQNHRNQEFIIE